jgi:hypothetical protein
LAFHLDVNVNVKKNQSAGCAALQHIYWVQFYAGIIMQAVVTDVMTFQVCVEPIAWPVCAAN